VLITSPESAVSSILYSTVILSFELFANVSMESDEVRSSTGIPVYVAGLDTTKLRRQTVVLVPGTTSVLLFANRSCHLPTTDETGLQTSAR